MSKKELIRSIVFLLIVGFMFIILCDLFEQENNKNFDKRLYTYRNLNEDTIDAVYIGASGVDRFWIAAKAYDEYGMTVYPLSVDQMPAWLFVPMIEEAQTYQSPELYILDIRAFTQSQDVQKMDIRARRVLDAMDFFSVNRIKTAFRTMKIIHQADNTKPEFDISYLLSFVKYHSKLLDESYRFKDNIGSMNHSYVGFNMNPSETVKRKKIHIGYFHDSEEELDPVSESALLEVLDYIEKNNLNVLFVDSPQEQSKEEAGRSNTIYKMLEERSMKYVTYYDAEAETGLSIDLDIKQDFYDSGHVNYYGAEKYTDALASYLDENYDLPDRREDQSVKEYWDGKYSMIMERIKIYEERDN